MGMPMTTTRGMTTTMRNPRSTIMLTAMMVNPMDTMMVTPMTRSMTLIQDMHMVMTNQLIERRVVTA